MRVLEFIARAIVLLLLLPVHEYAHGAVATRLGDPTPREQGRLTLNPLRHLDILGSLLLLTAGFGWAKPVIVDPRNFKNPRRDMALVAAAGPLSNLAMALASFIVYKAIFLVPLFPGFGTFLQVSTYIVGSVFIINVQLAIFNLLPVPPLDGSRILGLLLPEKIYWGLMRYERYIMLALMAVLWLGWLSTPLEYLTHWLLSLLF